MQFFLLLEIHLFVMTLMRLRYYAAVVRGLEVIITNLFHSLPVPNHQIDFLLKYLFVWNQL